MISVVIPLYNKADTIEAAVRSVQQQSHSDWQLVVVDDGSRDDGPERVRRMAANDARISLIVQPNGGVSAARNRGVQAAGSDLVALLDADDTWLPGHLQQLSALHDWQPDAPMWAAAYRLVDDAGMDRVVRHRDAQGQRYLIDDYFADSVALEFPLHSSAVMISRRALKQVGGFPIGVGSGEDLLTWARLSVLGAVPFGCEATAVYVSPPISPMVRASVVRKPVVPDQVAAGLWALATAYPARAPSIRQFIGLWLRIRSMSHLELNQRLASLSELWRAVRLTGLKRRDVASVVLCLLPWELRTAVLARGRGWRAQGGKG